MDGEGGGSENGNGERGSVRAGAGELKACSGPALPGGSGQRWRAAVSSSTRRPVPVRRSATAGRVRWPSEPVSEPDDVILRSSFFKFVKH